MAVRKLGCLAVVLSACAVAPARDQPSPPTDEASTSSCAIEAGQIAGVVRDETSREGLEGALVILQGSALPEVRETSTNANGLYAFRGLPPGTYTVQVLYARADVAKVTTLAPGAKYRISFRIDPEDDGIVCRLPAGPRRSLDESLMSLDSNEAKLLGRPKVRRRL